jgi:hypothetical protein
MIEKKYMHLHEGLTGYMPFNSACVDPNSMIPSDITYGIEEHYFNVHVEEPPIEDLTFLIDCWRNRQDAIVYCQHESCLFYVSIEFFTEHEHAQLNCELGEWEG